MDSIEVIVPGQISTVEVESTQGVIAEVRVPNQIDTIEIETEGPIKTVEVIVPSDITTIDVTTNIAPPDWTFRTKITVSNTAPQAPRIGDLWIDTN